MVTRASCDRSKEANWLQARASQISQPKVQGLWQPAESPARLKGRGLGRAHSPLAVMPRTRVPRRRGPGRADTGSPPAPEESHLSAGLSR